MFRKFPVYQRLISWTKPDAPFERGTREYEWYDHNSLARRRAGLIRRSRPSSWTARSTFRRATRWSPRSSSSPARGGVEIRHGCEWLSTELADGQFVLDDDGRRIPLPCVRLRAGHHRAVEAGDPGPRACRALRGHAARGTLRGEARVHPRQAELRLRSRAGPPAVGAAGHPRVAASGGHRGARVLAPSPALSAALRRARPRRVGELRRRRGDRERRPQRRRVPHPGERHEAGRATSSSTATP